jgi:outer membrane lipoprotein-sorting protein
LKKAVTLIQILSIIVTLFISGCVPSKPIDEVEILPSERLINKLEANRRKIRNFEGVGVLKIKSEQYDNSANFRVVMQKPDSIYLTILGPFGIELAQALVTNQNYIFYDALENTIFSGKVNDDILRDIFKINLSFSDLLDAFVGSVNLTKNLYKQPDNYEVDYDKYVLTYIDSINGITTMYKVDIRELSITDYRLKANDGSVNIVGMYSGFELLENVAVPFSIEIQNRLADQKLNIEYRNIVANQHEIFIDFVVPDDATIISW